MFMCLGSSVRRYFSLFELKACSRFRVPLFSGCWPLETLTALCT